MPRPVRRRRNRYRLVQHRYRRERESDAALALRHLPGGSAGAGAPLLRRERLDAEKTGRTRAHAREDRPRASPGRGDPARRDAAPRGG